jgi:hypothetical protein
MVTGTHEAHHSIFRHDDDLFPEVMEQVFGVVLGKAAQVTCLSTDLTERQPLERRADSVLLAELLVEDEGSKYIVVVEAQTDPDDKKSWSWPYYIAYLRARYECPVILLVVCTKSATERWARAEITSGLGDLICMRVTPAVVGPGNVKPVTDLDKARANVGFAAFSALTHSRTGPAREILGVLAEALGSTDAKNGQFLAELVEAGLDGTSSYEVWRDLMITNDYPHVSQWRAQATQQGIERGIERGIGLGVELGSIQTRKNDIFRTLARRKIGVPKAERKRIEGCTDMGTLEVWLDRSYVIDEISELFAE